MLSLFFRYVWFDEESTKYSAHEDFVVFLCCQKVSGGELFNILIEYVTEKNIPMENWRGQAYDGRANMAGCNNGLQAHAKAALALMHFNYDVEVPYELPEKWSGMKKRLMRLNINDWYNEESTA